MQFLTRRILLAVCVAIFSISLVIDAKEKRTRNLFLIRVDKKAGYIDRTGKVAIKPIYEDAEDFSEGLAPVKIDAKWGFIDESGQMVIEPRFDWIYWAGFSEGIVPAGINKKVGAIDRQGKFVIDPIYEMAREFSDGLMPVKFPGKQWDYSWIYVDAVGRKAIDREFFGADSFVNGRAFVKVGFDEWALIDKTGNQVTKQHFGSKDSFNIFSEGLTAVKVKKKWGYIDRDGKFIIKPQFDDAENFSEGLAAVRVGCNFGYIDKRGNLVIPANFETAWKFSNGLAPVALATRSTRGLRYKSNGRWIQSCGLGVGSFEPQGYIDRTGKIVIEPIFGRAFIFNNGIAQVSFGEPPDVIGAIGKRGYIDKTGKYIWAPTQ